MKVVKYELVFFSVIILADPFTTQDAFPDILCLSEDGSDPCSREQSPQIPCGLHQKMHPSLQHPSICSVHRLSSVHLIHVRDTKSEVHA